MRDKERGLQRLEVKIEGEIIDALNDATNELGLTRADIISHALKQWLHL